MARSARSDVRDEDTKDPALCAIVSPDELNRFLRRIVVAPMTGGSHSAPFRVLVSFWHKPGLILLDQIPTVDRQRLVTRLGSLEETALAGALDVPASMFGR